MPPDTIGRPIPLGGDFSYGARPGADGKTPVGIARILQTDLRSALVILTDGSQWPVTLPSGKDGLPPSFIQGATSTVPSGGTPSITFRAAPYANTYYVDAVLVAGPTGPVPWQTPPAAWAAYTSYTSAAPASTVTTGGLTYVCAVDHISGTSFDQTKWVQITVQGQASTINAAFTVSTSAPSGGADGDVWFQVLP